MSFQILKKEDGIWHIHEGEKHRALIKKVWYLAPEGPRFEFQLGHFQSVQLWIIHLVSLNLCFLSLKLRYKNAHLLCYGQGQGR